MHFLTESCWEFFLPALCNASPFSGKSNKKQASIWIPYPTPTLSSAGRLLQALNCSTEMSPDPAVSGKCPGETYGKHVPWLGAGVIIFLITATTVLYVVFFFSWNVAGFNLNTSVTHPCPSASHLGNSSTQRLSLTQETKKKKMNLLRDSTM